MVEIQLLYKTLYEKFMNSLSMNMMFSRLANAYYKTFEKN